MSLRSESARRAGALRELLRSLRADLALLAQRERMLRYMLENQEADKSMAPSLKRVTLQRRQAQADLRAVRAALEPLDVRLAEVVEVKEAG